jgi:spermidine synthase
MPTIHQALAAFAERWRAGAGALAAICSEESQMSASVEFPGHAAAAYSRGVCRAAMWRIAWGLWMIASLWGAPAAQAQETMVEARESKYNNIYVYKRDKYYTMTFGHNKRFYTETIYDTTNELALPVAYTRYMTVALAYAAEASDAVEIGFGGGRTAWYLHRHMPALKFTSVELDPAVFELAQKYFGVKPENKFDVKVADGRNYLLRRAVKSDVIMIDAYRGPFVPFHLLTKEFFELVRSRLKPGGVAVQNIEPTTMMFDAAIATIRSVFSNMDLYEAEGNVVAVAYDGPPLSRTDLRKRAQKLQDKYKFVYALPELLAKRKVVRRTPGVTVLTDDFAPVESLLAIERHNKKLDALTQGAPSPQNSTASRGSQAK